MQSQFWAFRHSVAFVVFDDGEVSGEYRGVGRGGVNDLVPGRAARGLGHHHVFQRGQRYQFVLFIHHRVGRRRVDLVRALADLHRAFVMRGAVRVGVCDPVGRSEDRHDLFAPLLDLALEIVEGRPRVIPGRHRALAFVEFNVFGADEILFLPRARVADVTRRPLVMLHYRAVRGDRHRLLTFFERRGPAGRVAVEIRRARAPAQLALAVIDVGVDLVGAGPHRRIPQLRLAAHRHDLIRRRVNPARRDGHPLALGEFRVAVDGQIAHVLGLLAEVGGHLLSAQSLLPSFGRGVLIFIFALGPHRIEFGDGVRFGDEGFDRVAGLEEIGDELRRAQRLLFGAGSDPLRRDGHNGVTGGFGAGQILAVIAETGLHGVGFDHPLRPVALFDRARDRLQLHHRPPLRIDQLHDASLLVRLVADVNPFGRDLARRIRFERADARAAVSGGILQPPLFVEEEIHVARLRLRGLALLPRFQPRVTAHLYAFELLRLRIDEARGQVGAPLPLALRDIDVALELHRTVFLDVLRAVAADLHRLGVFLVRIGIGDDDVRALRQGQDMVFGPKRGADRRAADLLVAELHGGFGAGYLVLPFVSDRVGSDLEAVAAPHSDVARASDRALVAQINPAVRDDPQALAPLDVEEGRQVHLLKLVPPVLVSDVFRRQHPQLLAPGLRVRQGEFVALDDRDHFAGQHRRPSHIIGWRRMPAGAN